eukprot:3455866-Pyramimonas_sp.AAC.1
MAMSMPRSSTTAAAKVLGVSPLLLLDRLAHLGPFHGALSAEAVPDEDEVLAGAPLVAHWKDV